jgi:peptidoglycan hydrolase-like protein with peptidoglycan-binding domain
VQPQLRRHPRPAISLLPAALAVGVAATVLLAPVTAAATPVASAAPTAADAAAPAGTGSPSWDGVAPTTTALIEANARFAAAHQTHVVGVVGEVVPAAVAAPASDAAAHAPVVVAAPAAPVRPAQMGNSPIGKGTRADIVTALQTRLTWAGISTPRTGHYDVKTAAGVTLWQQKRNLPATGRADAATVASLAHATSTDGRIVPLCDKPGITLCVDKTQKMFRFYDNGTLVRQWSIQVGPEKGQKEYGRYSSTRLGTFTVQRMERNHVSSEYGTPMPYAMFFDQGIAFHPSNYFAEAGYANSSYGCVTNAKPADSAWLFAHTKVGTRVVVHA